MKRAGLLLIFFLILFSCCAKKNIDSDVLHDKISSEDIKTFLEGGYTYKINASKPMIDLELHGLKDIFGNISLNGYMDVAEESRIVYDHVYDKNRWSKRKDDDNSFADEPINPQTFIENVINYEQVMDFKKSGRKYVSAIKANVALIDPINYFAEGNIETDKNLTYLILTSKREGLDIYIKLNKESKKSVKVKRTQKLSAEIIADKKCLDIIGKRFTEFDLGYFEKRILRSYCDDAKIFENIIKEDSLILYSFSYIDPSSEYENMAFIKSDPRNSILLEYRIANLSCMEYSVETKGNLYDIDFRGLVFDEAKNIAVSINGYALNAEYVKSAKSLLLKNLTELQMKMVLSVCKYPLPTDRAEINYKPEE